MPNFKVILTNTANKTANVRTIKGKTEINVTNQDVVIIRHAKKNTFIGKEKFEVVRKGDDLEIILSENPLEVLVLKGFYLTDGTIKITAVTGDDTLNAINEETQSLLTLSDGESVSIDFTGQQFEVDTAVFDEFDFDSSGAILLAAIVGIGAIIAGGEIFSDTKSIGDVYVTPPGQLENIIIDGRKPDGTFGKGTPTIKGKGDPDDSIIVDVDTNGDGKADDTFVFSPNPGPGELPGKFNPDGTFEINLPPDYDLPEGDVNITVTPKDSYGNKGPGTDIPLFVDKTAPNSPEVDQFALDNIGDYQGNLNDGDVTDDTRPTFTGKGEPDGIVNVYINGEKQTFNAQESQPTVDSQGNWTFELPPSAALKDGDNTITFTVTDKAGNESDHTPPFNVKVDTSPAPEALSPDSWKIIDDANEDELIGSKEINNGDVTDDNQPTLSGTAPAGVSQIAIFINGKEVARVDTNKNGNWTYQIDDKLNDGDNQIEVAPINRAGNIGEKSSVEFTVDTNLPSASNPMVSELTLTADQGTILGAINNGSTTDDATPVLSGKAEPSIQSIKIYLTDPFGQLTFLAQVPVDEDGVWQFDPPKQYLSGANTLHVVPVTAAGYELAVQDAPTYSFEFTGALPSQVALLSVLEIGDNYSMVNPEDETNQNQLLVRGSAEPNTTVNIMVDGRVVGTTTSNEKGYWEYELNLDSLSNGQARSFSTFSSAAEDGVYKISASMPDSTGGIWETADWEIKLNRSEPAAPELIEVLDHQGAEKDVLVNQSTTDDTLPILKGKGLANSTIEIYDNGLLIGTTKTNNQGEWIFVPPNQLANGLHSITMVQLNKVGNKSQPSEPFIVNVDSIPGNLVITSAEYSKNGSLKIAGENTYINDNLPTIKGIGPVGAIIEITVNDQKGTAVVDDSGHWSFKVLSPLNDGDYIFKARIVGANRDIDTDELLSAKEETFSLKVLVALPDAPIITEILDTVGSVQQDVLSREGKIHNDPAPYIKGTGEPGYTVNLYNFGKLVGTTIVKSDGSWELVAVNPYIGENKYTVTTVDMVNDESTPSPELIINYDPTLNTTPWPENDDGLLFLIDDVQTLGQENSDLNYKEFIARGETTNDNKPTFTGKAPLGAKTIKVYLDGEEVAIVPVIDGSWSYTPDENLEDGEHKFEVAVLSQYGNEGPKSKEWNFIVDTSSPGSIENLNIEGYNPDTDGLNTTTPTITGKGEAGQDVVVTLPNGEELVFSTDPKEGEYPLSYGPTDGNGKADFALEIPEGKLTDNTSGDLSVKQRDDAGNDSPASTYPVLVDTTPPGSIENLNIEGYNPDTDGLNTTTPTITGKGEAGQDVVVTLPNGEELVFSTDPKGDEYPLTYGPTDENGNAEFELQIPEGKLTDNTSGDLSVNQRDDAGNDSPALTYPVLVDTTAPGSIENLNIEGYNPDTDGLNTTTPTITGKGEAGQDVVVTLPNGEELVFSTDPKGDEYPLTYGPTDENGNAEFELQIPEGKLTDNTSGDLSVNQRDDAGNDSPALTYPVLVDTTAPGSIENLNIEGYNPDTDGLNTTTPTITGKGEAGQDVVVTLPNGEELVFSTDPKEGEYPLSYGPTDGNGKADFTLEIPEGKLTDNTSGDLSVKQRDDAGNDSPASTYPVLVDTTPPGSIENLNIEGYNPDTDGLNTTTPTITGKGEAGQDVVVTLPNGEELVFSTDPKGDEYPLTYGPTDENGNAEFELQIPEGKLTDNTSGDLSVNQRDDAGNDSPALTYPVLVDTTAPGSIENLNIEGYNPDTDGLNTTTPTITGKGEAGQDVVVTLPNGEELVFSTDPKEGEYPLTYGPTDEDGNAEFELQIPEGNLSENESGDISVNQRDEAGNNSPSATYPVIVDTTPPGSIENLNIEGYNPDTDGLNTTTPTITGKGEAGQDVVVTLPNGEELVFSTDPKEGEYPLSYGPTDEDGNAEFELQIPEGKLTDNTSGDLSVKQRDEAGNNSPALNYPVLVDTTPPGSIENLNIEGYNPETDGLNTTTPTITGKGEAGQDVVVTLPNGEELVFSTDPKDGEYPLSYGPTDEDGNAEFELQIPEGKLTDNTSGDLSVKQRDDAGNNSPALNYPVLVDTTPPGSIENLNIEGYNPETDGLNTTTPTITGKGEAGQDVVVTLPNGEELVFSTDPKDGEYPLSYGPTDEDGNAEFELQIPEGKLTDYTSGDLSVKQRDDAGNNSPSATYPVIVDTTPPGSIENLNIEGYNPDTDGLNTTTPTITGKGEAGQDVVVTLPNGEELVFSTDPKEGEYPLSYGPTDEDGNAEFELQIPEGKLTDNTSGDLSVKQRDDAGNNSPALTYPVLVDTTAPGSIENLNIEGYNPDTDGLNTTTPTITGKGEAGQDVVVTLPNGEELVFSTDPKEGEYPLSYGPTDEDGNAEFELQIPEGKLTDNTSGDLSVNQRDDAGNNSPASTYPVLVDTTPPGSIENLNIEGYNPDTDGLNTTTPTITGKGEAGQDVVVTLPNGEELVFSTDPKGDEYPLTYGPTDENGNAEFELQIPEGKLTDNTSGDLSVKQRDDAGNNSPALTYPVLVDTTAPGSIENLNIEGYNPDTDGLNTTTPTITGKGEAGQDVVVTLPNGEELVFSTDPKEGEYPLSYGPTDEDGNAEFELQIPEGKLTDNTSGDLSVNQRDDAGNNSPASTYPVLVDITPPGSIENLNIEGYNPDTDGLNTTTPTITGKGEAGQDVVVTLPNGEELVFSTDPKGDEYPLTYGPTDENGNAEFELQIPEGKLTDNTSGDLSVKQRDDAGNNSPALTYPVLVDTTAPGSIENLNIEGYNPDTDGLNTTTPTITGKGEAGQDVVVTLPNGEELVFSTDPKGDEYPLTYGPTDENGNAEFELQIPEGKLTDNTSGDLSVKQRDDAGNDSPALTYPVLVDTTAPGSIENLNIEGYNPDTDGLNTTTPTITGKGEAGQDVVVTLPNGEELVFSTDPKGDEYPLTYGPTDENGNAEFELQIPEGKLTDNTSGDLSVKQRDDAGNNSPALTYPVLVDTTPPGSIENLNIEGYNPDTDGLNTTTPTITGKGEAGQDVVVTLPNGEELVFSTDPKEGEYPLTYGPTDEDGNAEFELQIPEGNLSENESGDISVNQRDEAGNNSPSATYPVIVDTTPPGSIENLNIEGYNPDTDGLNTTTPTITGKGEAGQDVVVTLPNGEELVFSTDPKEGEYPLSYGPTDEDGNAEFELQIPEGKLTDNTSGDLSVNQRDDAGNDSPALTYPVLVDTTPPGSIENLNIEGYNPDTDGLNTTTPTITGKGEAGQDVVVTLPNGEELVFSTDPKEGEYPLSYGPTDEDGNAEFELQIPEGKLTDNTSGDLSVNQRDDAGNNSPSATYPVIVDTTPPGSIENLNIEGYNPETDGLNTTTPTITGKGEAGQDVVVTLPNGEELVFSTDPKEGEYPLTYGPTDEDGNAEFELQIPEGKLTDNTSGDLSVKQRDDAGNNSPSATYPVIVDTTPPGSIENLNIEGYNPETDGLNTTTPTITGKGEAGQDVVVTLPNGEELVFSTDPKEGEYPLSYGPTDEDGNAEFELQIPEGKLTDNTSGDLSVNQRDDAGNDSPALTYPVLVDTTPPGSIENLNIEGYNPDTDGLNTTTPTITGKGEAGQDVVVTLPNGEELVFSTDPKEGEYPLSYGPTDENGNAEFELQIPEGKLTDNTSGDLSVKQRDDAGNNSPALTYPVLVDTTPPGSIENLNIEGYNPDTDGLNTTTPTITGKGEAGQDVVVTLPNGEELVFSTDPKEGEYPLTYGPTDEDGNAEFELQIPEGKLTDNTSGDLSVNQRDDAGNDSPALTYPVLVDTTPPGSIENLNIEGYNPDTDGLNTTTPTITGKGEAGQDVVVTLPNGEELVFSTDPKEGEYPLSYGPTDEDGNAEFELQIPEGKLTDNTSGDLSVKQRDDAGNNSPALTYPVLVDTTPPGSIENLNIEGYNPDTDGLNTTTPTITGKGEAGQDVVVTLPNGEELVFSTDPKGDEYPLTYGPTDGNGNADFTLEIPEGKLTDNTSGDLSVKQRDDAGNDSPALTYPVIVDISAPENIEVFITSISDDSGVIDDFITNDKTLVISGTISRTLNTDERVEISIDGGNTWALVDLQGQNWSFENTNNLLLDGTFTAQVRVIDIANNVGAIYEQDITVDTVGPGNNAIEILAITPDTGIDGDFKTSTNTITVSGIIDNKLANDEIIKVTFDGGKTWKDAIVNNNTWSVELGPLADNNYTLQAQIFDIAGNPGAVDSQDLQIDGTEVGENTILIQSISDDSGAESDFITNDNTLIVNGTLDKPLGIGESIEIRINNENWIKVPAVNIINNNWVFTGFEDRILNDGDYIIDVRIVNIVGNTGSIDTKQITIDTVGPDINNKVYFDRISDDAGFADNDFKTNDTSLEFFGHLDKELEENEYVEISFDDGLTWNKTIVSGTEWYYDRQATPFENGTYKVKVRVIDYTGNLGYVTDSQDLVIDDSQIFQNSIVITDISDDKGVSNTDFVTNDNTLVLRGTIEETLESGQYIRLSLDGGNSWLRATVNPDGKSWILDLSQNTLGDGIYDLKAQIVNEFGTPEAEYVQSLTIDTAVTQTTISIDGISDDTNIDNDFNTADDTLIFYGSLSTSLDKDEFVQISLDGGLTWKLATVDGKNWTYDNTSQPLADKLDGYDVKVRVVDEAGNISGQDSQNVIINKAPPVGDVTVDPIATLDTTPTITGTFSGLRKGETVQVTIAGKVYSEINGNLTVNNSTGKWSLKIADADAINYSGRNNLELDVQAQIVTLSGAVKEDSSTDELTIYRAATVTKSPDFDYLADDTPAFVGRGNVGNGDVITVVIKNELGQTITTFTSNPGGGIEVDKLNSSWKITGNAWTSKGLSLDKGTYTITTSTSTLDGQGQQSGNTEEFTIFKPETTPAVTTVNRQDTASKVYAQPDGSYWLFYVTNSGANYNNDFNLYARKFNQKGEPISNQITIANSPYSDGHSLTDNLHFIYAYDVVFNDQGEFRVFYTSVNSQTPYIANFDKDGNRLSQGPTTNVQAFELDPTIVQMDNGDYVVFFASGTIHDYNLYMQRYKADGTAIDTTPVAQTTGVNAGNSFTFNLDGLVGAIQGSTNTSTTDGLNATHVSGDIYAVTYMSSKNRFDDGNTRDTDVWLRLYDFKTGKPLGEDVQVNVEDKFLQISPVVAYLADGTIVVTYLSNHTSTNGTAGNIQDFDIYSRRFKLDAENKLVALDDTDVRVNTTTDGVNGMLFDRVSTHYDMTALKHGGYVVTWSKFTAGNRAEVYSQAFDAAGNKLGGETLVSTNSSEFIDARPYVSALDDGGYVITWTKMADSNTNAWTNYTGDIYSVVVNADGSIRGQGDENVYPTNASYLDGTGALVGSDSVNTLDDKNGATSFDAGEGNDYIIISDSDFDFVDGNEGDDTLIWNSFEDLNLSDISGKVTSIEYIHMNDAYANTLTLNIEDVLAMTPENDHLLVIQGGEEDTVDLDLSNNEWSSLGAQTFRGETYNVFVHATEDAQLWIQQDIPVI